MRTIHKEWEKRGEKCEKEIIYREIERRSRLQSEYKKYEASGVFSASFDIVLVVKFLRKIVTEKMRVKVEITFMTQYG